MAKPVGFCGGVVAGVVEEAGASEGVGCGVGGDDG